MEKIHILNILLLALLFTGKFCLGKLPNTIKTCSRNEPNLSKCVLNAVEELSPRLKNGVLAPDFIVPALEPLALDNIKMDRGTEFKATFSNLIVRGPSNFTIEKMRVKLQDGLNCDFIINLPLLEFVGRYSLKMKILLLDISGKGDMDGKFENCRARVRMRAPKYEKNGETYIKFEPFAIKIQIGKNALHLKNLFNGDPNLGKIGNQFINENSNLFLDEVIPGLEKNLAEIFTKTANDIVSTASFDEIFPDTPPKNIY